MTLVHMVVWYYRYCWIYLISLRWEIIVTNLFWSLKYYFVDVTFGSQNCRLEIQKTCHFPLCGFLNKLWPMNKNENLIKFPCTLGFAGPRQVHLFLIPNPGWRLFIEDNLVISQDGNYSWERSNCDSHKNWIFEFYKNTLIIFILKECFKIYCLCKWMLNRISKNLDNESNEYNPTVDKTTAYFNLGNRVNPIPILCTTLETVLITCY